MSTEWCPRRHSVLTTSLRVPRFRSQRAGDWAPEDGRGSRRNPRRPPGHVPWVLEPVSGSLRDPTHPPCEVRRPHRSKPGASQGVWTSSTIAPRPSRGRVRVESLGVDDTGVEYRREKGAPGTQTPRTGEGRVLGERSSNRKGRFREPSLYPRLFPKGRRGGGRDGRGGGRHMHPTEVTGAQDGPGRPWTGTGGLGIPEDPSGGATRRACPNPDHGESNTVSPWSVGEEPPVTTGRGPKPDVPRPGWRGVVTPETNGWGVGVPDGPGQTPSFPYTSSDYGS